MQSILRLLNKYELTADSNYSDIGEITIHKRKTIILTNQISFLIVLIGISFIIFDLANEIYDTQIFYVIISAICIGAYLLNRKYYHAVAKHAILITVILATFLFSLRVSQETFVSLMYFPIIIAAFALFDYKHIWVGCTYLGVCLILYFLDVYGNIEMFYTQELNAEVVKNNRVINYIIILVSSVFLILFILSVNYQTEEMIKTQNEELIKTNDELDKFVYSTSHDLRAPLMSILGLINIAEKENDVKMIMECLRMVEDRIHTLDNFITEIIDISRNKKSDVEIAPIKVKETIDSILDEFKFMERFDQLNFELDIEDELIAYSDATRFNLIMKNLISNAIKYHNYAIEKPTIQVAAVPEEFTLKVKVTDNGYGIPEEQHNKLFDMFFRGTQQGKGTGLGLYIVQETALKLNGKVSLVSKVGSGSTFELEIPNFHENGHS